VTGDSPRGFCGRRRGVGVDAAAQGGPEEVLVLLRLLSVVGYVEA
jgi:hypothetical protein